MENLNELMSDAQYAIRHYESSDAKEISKIIQNFLQTADVKNVSVDISKKLKKILVYLKLASIPSISDEESAEILRKNFLDSFDAEIDMENLLTTKLFYIPEFPRDELRAKLKKALMENQQRLGNLTVGQWIQEFERTFPVKTRAMNASAEFTIKNPQTQFLNPLEKSRLKELLHTYDYLLVTTLPATGPSLENILSATSSGSATSQNRAYSVSIPYQSRQEVPEIEPFNDALRKYPEFGEQLITSKGIKLQGFPEPVRPSVKNWIADFTSSFGYERNNPMKRQDYIFRSANGQNLNQEERERLSFVLRSFEENSLVNFQKDTKQLIFGQASRVSPLDSQENSVSFTPKSQPEEKKTAPSENLSFSFPQRMPFEKPAETIEPKPERPVPAPIVPPAPVVSNANPNIVKIAPKPTPVPKNVVNLKDFQ